MRIPLVYSLGFCPYALASRNALIGLLENSGPRGGAELLDDIGSFVQRVHMTSGVSLVSANPDRRRGGHLPCECPESPGDVQSTACLNRRVDLVLNQTGVLKDTNSTTGLSIEGARVLLRGEYAALHASAEALHEKTGNLYGNLSNDLKGYVKREDGATAKLLNEETLMIYSINNAWMNIVNTSGKLDEGALNLSATLYKSTRELIPWFNKLQRAQEFANGANLNTTVAKAQSALDVYVNRINGAQSRVYESLASLSNEVGNATDSTRMLTNSMNESIDSVQSQIDILNETIASLIRPTNESIKEVIDDAILNYKRAGRQEISTFVSSSKAKLAEVLNSTKALIVGHNVSSSALLSNARARLGNVSHSLVEREAELRSAIPSSLARIENITSHRVEVLSGKVSDFVGKYEARASRLTELVSEINNALAMWNRTEKSSVMNGQVNGKSLATAASQTVRQLQRIVTSLLTQISTRGVSLSSDAVQAVGVDFQSSLAKLGHNVDSLVYLINEDTARSARDSANVMGGLEISSSVAEQALSSAAGSVQNALQSSSGDILSRLGNMPAMIGKIASLLAKAVGEAVYGAEASKNENLNQVSLATSSSLTGAAKDASGVEASISSWLSDMKENEPAAEDLVSRIKSGMSILAQNSVGGNRNAHNAYRSTSRSMADASDQVAESEEASLTALGESVSKLLAMGTRTTPMQLTEHLATSLSDAGDFLLSAKGLTNTATRAVESQTAAGLKALADSEQTMGMEGRKAGRSYGTIRDKVFLSQDRSLADVHYQAAFLEKGVSSAVSMNMNKVGNMEHQSRMKIDRLSAKQLEAVRSVAKSIVNLTKQTNAFLGDNAGPLAKQIRGLAVNANRLFLQLNALGGEAVSVVNSSQTTGGVSWREIARALDAIVLSKNSSAWDAVDQIEANFHLSADNIARTTQAEISNAISDFTDTSSSIKSKLNSFNPQTSALAPTNTTIGQIDKLGGAVVQNANRSINAARTLLGPLTPPAGMSRVYAEVQQGTLAAGMDSRFAADALTKLASDAKSRIDAAASFYQKDGFVNPGDVALQARQAEIAERIEKGKISSQRGKLDSLSKSSTSLSSDYMSQLRASAVAASQNATAVYNKIVQGKSQVAEMIGNIAAEYVIEQAGMRSDFAVSSDTKKINLAAMNRAVSGLLRVFDLFSVATNHSFSTSEAEMNNFALAILSGLKREFGVFEQQTLMEHKLGLLRSISAIHAEMANLNDTEIDTETDSLSSAFNDWVDSEESSLAYTTSALNALNKLNSQHWSSAESTLAQRTNDTVYSVALTAQDLLRSFNKTSPRLDDMIKTLSRPPS